MPDVEMIEEKKEQSQQEIDKISLEDPNEIYSKPITSSQEYGWWRQDGAPKTLPWTEIQKFSRVNSEMTRFVDEMTLTNKHFTLF